jgi:hypothetical protein
MSKHSRSADQARRSESTNPLATPDQIELDQLAVRVYRDYSFSELRSLAAGAYVFAHGQPIGPEAMSRLNAAIDELVFSAIQKAVNNDPYRPKVYWVDAPPRAWFGLNVPGGRYSYDNPDTIYRTIPIDGNEKYVLRGRRRRPWPSDVSFSLLRNVNSQRTIAALTGDELVVVDETFEITIDDGPANGRRNHIQSNAHAKQLFVRNAMGDWLEQTPDELSIERIGGSSAPPAPDEAQIAAWAEDNLRQSIVDYGIGALGIKTMRHPVNTLTEPKQSDWLGTLVTQASSFGHFDLSTDQALVITLRSGGASYFVFPTTDPWMITVDPGSYLCSLNNTQAAQNRDDTYTFVVSIVDPGVYNWISTSELHAGTIMARWQNLSAESGRGGPEIAVQLIGLDDLRDVLPPETRFVTPEERESQLERRRRGYARRFSE